MKARILFVAALALALVGTTARAQTVLAIDFNFRNTATPLTQSGFESFLINSNGGATATQTAPTTRSFGGYTVSLTNVGASGLNDRQRATPTDAGAFSSGSLLRDFVFHTAGSGNSGLDLSVSGLTTETPYRLTVWSFDSTSAGTRMSDWSANGFAVTNGYTFDGRVLPTTSQQYRFSFIATSDASGVIIVSSRRNSGSVNENGQAQPGVFLNALLIETTETLPPTITSDPSSLEAFTGDNVSFAVGNNGTPPFTYQWLFNDTNILGGATNEVLSIVADMTNAGTFSVIISNAAGSVTSAPAMLTVNAVSNLLSVGAGLIANWPLSQLIYVNNIDAWVLSDISGNHPMFATGMDAMNNIAEQPPRLSSISFNGFDEFVVRTNLPGSSLPVMQYPAYSVAMWVKGNFQGTNALGEPAAQSDRRVFSQSSDTNNTPLFTIGTDNTGTSGVVDIYIRTSSGSVPLNHRKSSLIAFDGNWHHIAWVDNNGSAQLYVDGVLDTNQFNYTRGVQDVNITALAAVVRTNSTAFFQGQIDEVAVWRRSLTSNEVNYVMRNGPVVIPGILTSISIAASNVTLRYVDPTGVYHYAVEEALALIGPEDTVWTEVTNATLSVEGNVATAQFPQSPGERRFYRLRSR